MFAFVFCCGLLAVACGLLLLTSNSETDMKLNELAAVIQNVNATLLNVQAKVNALGDPELPAEAAAAVSQLTSIANALDASLPAA